MLEIEIKEGNKLNQDELNIINYWRKKEFNSDTEWNETNKKSFYDDIVFLLKNGEEILAFGRLRPISVYKEEEKLDIWGIATIVSTERGKGYGKELMRAIRKYIEKNKKTSIGFCGEKNTVFYEKCGFGILKDGQKHFVYVDDSDKLQFEQGDVFYLKGYDNLADLLLKDDKSVFKHYVPHW